MGKQLNYKQMVKDIDEITNDDFLSDMEMKELPNHKEYTQSEAKRMSAMLGRIYLISHCIHCEACQGKYIIKDKQ